jgi:preprotein translocase subunit SecG
MSLFLFLTVVQALVAAALVGVVLMQRSEGGGLGIGGGGSPGGLMSARGAANFLTRATAVLATLFVVLSIILAAVAVGATTGRKIDDSLNRDVAPASQQQAPADPLAGAGGGAVAPASSTAPAPAPGPADPLSGAGK